MVKSIILTSRENFLWMSMEEIIPHLERCWLKTEKFNHEVQLCNVDEFKLIDLIKLGMHADNVILTCLNFKISQYAINLKKAYPEIRIIFHLHNMATIGLWPLNTFGLLSLISSNDVFISSCTRDLHTIRTLIKNKGTYAIPFSLSDSEIKLIKSSIPKETRNCFYYVGRISRQKNLHYVFYGLKNLKELGHIVSFEIFGSEDNLGSPNMGWNDSTYLLELKALAKSLNIENQITWHGKINRDTIYSKYISERSIFISLSAHSDENFGMAAFRSLLRKEKLLLSNWGGHIDFYQSNDSLTYLVDIVKKEDHLGVDVDELVTQMLAVLKAPWPSEDVLWSSEEDISKLLWATLNRNEVQGKLELSNICFDTLKRRELFAHHPTKIFDSYNDPLALHYFVCYGLTK